jgi:hypothetical protein
MLTKKIYLLTLLFFVLITAVSCTSDDDSSSEQNLITINNTVQTGSWRITKFIDSGRVTIIYNGIVYEK